MGYGEVVGNQSVHWRMVHEDEAAARKTLNTRPRTSARPRGDDEVNVDGTADGRDPVPPQSVGAKKGHQGRFRVRLRYRSMDEARAAGAWVAENVTAEDGMYVLTVDVPVISRRDAEDPPTAEVRIDW